MDWATVVRFWAGVGNYSLRHRVYTGSGADPASYQLCTGSSFPGVKRTRRDADHWTPSTTEIKNA